MASIDAKTLWPAVLSLGTATALVLFVLPESTTNRLSTLDIEGPAFDERYIQFLDTERTRAAIVERGATTVRRGELPDDGPEWDVRELGEGTWLARSPDEGVQFFVPVRQVSDWIYPFIYSFVRERRRGLELPAAEWTALHVDRMYRGLFLRVSLPFDRPGSPARRELLTVEGGRLASIDTWFEPMSQVPVVPPELEVEYRHGSVAWLSSLRAEDATQLLLSYSPLELTLLPLPVSVPALFAAAYGGGPTFRDDEHAARWNTGWRESLPDTTFLAEVEVEDLESAFVEYRELFLAALGVDGAFHGNAVELLATLSARQDSGRPLGLTLDGN